jgi:hypothetical protein
MLDLDSYPPAKESVQRLIRSGWSMYQTAYIGPRAETRWTISGSNGENKIRVERSTQREASHRAVEAGAACSMLKGWPRPNTGTGRDIKLGCVRPI